MEVATRAKRGGAQAGGGAAADPLQQNQLQDPLVQPVVQAPVGPAGWTDAQCMMKLQIEHESSWVKMHKNLGDSPEGKAARARFVTFRKTYVDGLIGRLREKYPGLLAKSVGSTDLTSDYDMTITTPNGDGDVEAMKEFNDQVKSDFGAQPGTVFDTNLYAKDYLGVEENIDKQIKAKVAQNTDLQDAPLAQPAAFKQSGVVDQDVASLVKIRRYMSQTDYDAYVSKIVGGIEDDHEKAAVLKQYEEADAIYQTGVAELLQRMGNVEVPDEELALTGAERRALGEMGERAAALYRAQLVAQKKAGALAHHRSDEVLEASNQIYYEKMKEVRKVQALAVTLDKLASDAPPLEGMRARQKADVLRAQAKKLLGDAIFFAAEAYHSEGAVKHVVAGLQGDKAQEALAALKPEDLLQSFNEQFGDLMKDVGHYADAPEGKLYYRTSKYVFRLFDAVKLLEGKAPVDAVVRAFGKDFGWSAAKMGAKVDSDLVQIRKGNVVFAPKGGKTADEVKDATAQRLGRQIYGVGGRDEYVTKMLDYSARLNAAVRSMVTSQVAPQETKAWFKNAE